MMVVSCDLFESNNNDGPSDKVYVALQNLKQVAIVNVSSGEIDYVDTDYSAISQTPHFIAIDDINRYWFVTTINSGYVGIYNLDNDELIDTIMVGDRPALMVLNEEDKKLNVSRMMPMEPMGMGAVSTIIQEISYEDSSQSVLSHEFELSSPAPHGLAINSDGSELYVTSFTADWLYKVKLVTYNSLPSELMAKPWGAGELNSNS
jgi:DNA-binding beta-propeller fold protein YncE